MSSLESGGKTYPSTHGNDTGAPDAIQIQTAGGQEDNPPADLTTHKHLEKELNELKRSQSLLATEKHALEMITDGASIQEILENLCIRFDAESSDFLSSILLMDPDGERLLCGPNFEMSLFAMVFVLRGPSRLFQRTARFLVPSAFTLLNRDLPGQATCS